MALGQISRANLRYLLNREIAIAALNGMMVAGVVATVAALESVDTLQPRGSENKGHGRDGQSSPLMSSSPTNSSRKSLRRLLGDRE
jgi:hypothetical protein